MRTPKTQFIGKYLKIERKYSIKIIQCQKQALIEDRCSILNPKQHHRICAFA
jgi:hypothetical protein